MFSCMGENLVRRRNGTWHDETILIILLITVSRFLNTLSFKWHKDSGNTTTKVLGTLVACKGKVYVHRETINIDTIRAMLTN